MSETKRFKIPRPICGVYKLYQGKNIVYVGQSTDIAYRIRSHVREDSKEFDRYSYMECPPEKLTELECEQILKHAPIYNTRLPNDAPYRTVAGIKRMLKIRTGVGPDIRRIRKCLIAAGLKPERVASLEWWNLEAAKQAIPELRTAV